MLKYILISLGAILIVGIIMGYTYLKSDKNAILKFIKDNPEQSAIYLVRNDKVLADWNAEKMMPLASTVKIIIAIEYAEQAAAGLINADEMIPLAELDKYYVKNTDGDAHPSWLKKSADRIVDGKISVREIAKGMILFSSNANTEWLIDYLGNDKVNARLDSMEIQHHDPIYPIVSALFVGKELFPDTKNKVLEEQLRALTMDEYRAACDKIHDILKHDESKKYKENKGDLGLNIQRIWSDNFTASTVKDYVAIMKKINSRTYFSTKTHEYLDEVMEFLLQNPRNRKWLEHTGMKGGSTMFVLTKALYATDKKGNKTELAYFFNDLNPFTNMALQRSMNDFELNILSNKDFISEIEKAFDKD